jgi:CheY-like chemotaxis protein
MPRLVLIVDDSEQCAVTLEIALLAIPGVAVTRFASGQEALRFLRAGGDVHALITDLNMPSMDGFDLIRSIRGDKRFARLPILVISGDTDPGVSARTRAAGADAFFPKPFSPLEVRRELERLLNVPSS